MEYVCTCVYLEERKALRPSNELITWVSRSHSEIESCERNSRARFNISLGAAGCEFLAKPPHGAEIYALCRFYVISRNIICNKI